MLISYVVIQIIHLNDLRTLLERSFVTFTPHVLYAIFILFVLSLFK